MGTKANPAPFDCYANAEDDEPMFVLLARDPSAPHMVEIWADLRSQTDGPTPKVLEARECARTMRAWRSEHRPECPGCQANGDSFASHLPDCIYNAP